MRKQTLALGSSALKTCFNTRLVSKSFVMDSQLAWFSSSQLLNGRPKKVVEPTSDEVPATPTAKRVSKTTIKDAETTPIIIDKTKETSQEKQTEIIIQSMDKLTKKYEKLEKAIAAQQELLSMMSTTLHVSFQCPYKIPNHITGYW